MKNLHLVKYSNIFILALALITLFSSCTDQWHEEQAEKTLVKHEWSLYMYVDGVQNEVVSVEEIRYSFKDNGTVYKHLSNDESLESTWEMNGKDYLRIGSSTFRINTLTNKILSLEYGEDVMYFLPED